MDGNNADLVMVHKRPDPFAEQRARMFRRLALLASTILFAYVVAGVTGYDLPNGAHEIWDSLVTLTREIVHIPA